MKRILFVDDEPRVLGALRRMLRPLRTEWEMTFTEGGAAALEAMEEGPFDVLISDMRMPGIDGPTLLGIVQEKYPQTVRIVLSGQADVEACMKVATVAHQFLTKPCDSALIKDVVTRACNLRDLLDQDHLRGAIGRIRSLLAVPEVYRALTVALADPEVSLDIVATIVEQDAGISLKILQLVNSSFFGLAREVDGIRAATSYLGTSMIQNIALSVEMFQSTALANLPANYSVTDEQNHSLLTARVARKIAPNPSMADQAFLAGMLHDVGWQILATNMPEQFEPDSVDLIAPGESEGNRQAFHAELGAYLLGLWGMSYPVVEAVANHHHPARVESTEFGLPGIVHVADALAAEACKDLEIGGRTRPEPLDMDYLESVGLVSELAAWRSIARKEAAPGAGDEAGA